MPIKQVYVSYDRDNEQSEDEYRFCPFCASPLALQESGHRLRPACTECGFIHFRNPAPAVSVVVVDGDRVLLGRRGGNPGKGKWAFPSGYVEWEDDFLTTAIQEVREETGLDVEIQTIPNVVSSFTAPGFHFLAIYLLAHVVGGEQAASDDLDAVDWFPISGPLPGMAFEEDVEFMAWYSGNRQQGLPVDPGFAGPEGPA